MTRKNVSKYIENLCYLELYQTGKKHIPYNICMTGGKGSMLGFNVCMFNLLV